MRIDRVLGCASYELLLRTYGRLFKHRSRISCCARSFLGIKKGRNISEIQANRTILRMPLSPGHGPAFAASTAKPYPISVSYCISLGGTLLERTRCHEKLVTYRNNAVLTRYGQTGPFAVFRAPAVLPISARMCCLNYRRSILEDWA